MDSGKHSPIVTAIAVAEAGTSGEIRVHLSRRSFEPRAFARAQRLFRRFGMTKTRYRNGVLLYVNLRRHRFAIVGDEGIHREVGAAYWDRVAAELRDNLLSTHPENAIAMAVIAIGRVLQKHFPIDLAEDPNPNELPNEVSSD